MGVVFVTPHGPLRLVERLVSRSGPPRLQAFWQRSAWVQSARRDDKEVQAFLSDEPGGFSVLAGEATVTARDRRYTRAEMVEAGDSGDNGPAPDSGDRPGIGESLLPDTPGPGVTGRGQFQGRRRGHYEKFPGPTARFAHSVPVARFGKGNLMPGKQSSLDDLASRMRSSASSRH